MSYHTYLLDPVSPLVLRTGKPFDQAGDPVSLDFPLPSTVAGAFRTAFGDYKDWDFGKKTDDLKKIPVHGPLAAAIEGEKTTPLFPRPADALYLRDKQETIKVCHLQPEDLMTGEITDLPHPGLRPVFLQKTGKFKSVSGSEWWSNDNFLKWLCDPSRLHEQPEFLGWNGPERELRTHVAIDSKTFSGEKSKLFQTECMDFGPCRKHAGLYEGWNNTRYGLMARVKQGDIVKDFCRFGGEGRICSIKKVDAGWPVLPDDLSGKLKTSEFIRIVLVTPALFGKGWQPSWLDENLTGSPPCFPGIKLKLRSFACHRWQPVSGWDLQKKKSRPVRRMVPAGSVYWFEVLEGCAELPDLWMQPVCDDEQDRLDGFGLVVTGIWEK